MGVEHVHHHRKFRWTALEIFPARGPGAAAGASPATLLGAGHPWGKLLVCPWRGEGGGMPGPSGATAERRAQACTPSPPSWPVTFRLTPEPHGAPVSLVSEETVCIRRSEVPPALASSDPATLLSWPVHCRSGPLLRECHAVFQLLLEGHRGPAQESSQQRPVSAGPPQGARVLWAELASVTLVPCARYKCYKCPPKSGYCRHPTFQLKKPRTKEVLPSQELGSAAALPPAPGC